MMATRDDFDDFFGDDDTPVIDTRADGRLYRVPLARLAPNLVNPRTDFGTEDQLIDLGKSLARRQNQPCPVVSRTAYLKLWPEHGDHLGDVDYVLVSGERRFRGATVAGLASLDCVVNDDVAQDRKTFMEAVVSENVDRQNFDPVEEAYAVQALVAEFGSNRAVAQHFDRVDGWVTQRLLLTHLCREVQDLVREKSLPLEAARSLGKLARDNQWGARDQLAWWEEEQDRRAAVSAARSTARKQARQQAGSGQGSVAAPRPAPSQATPQPESFTAVKHGADPEPARPPLADSDTKPLQSPPVPPPEPSPRLPPVSPAAADARPAADSIPEPRADTQPGVRPLPGPPQPPEPGRTEQEQDSADRQQPRLPYDDGNFIGHHLIRKMPPGELVKVLSILREHAERNGLDVEAAG